MPQQLVFAALADAPPSPAASREFVRGVRVDRSGMAQYVHLIRAADDPERSPRSAGGRADRAPDRTLSVRPVATCSEDILRLLSDGRARTFNAIGVELLDLTSATLFGRHHRREQLRLQVRAPRWPRRRGAGVIR